MGMPGLQQHMSFMQGAGAAVRARPAGRQAGGGVGPFACAEAGGPHGRGGGQGGLHAGCGAILPRLPAGLLAAAAGRAVGRVVVLCGPHFKQPHVTPALRPLHAGRAHRPLTPFCTVPFHAALRPSACSVLPRAATCCAVLCAATGMNAMAQLNQQMTAMGSGMSSVGPGALAGSQGMPGAGRRCFCFLVLFWRRQEGQRGCWLGWGVLVSLCAAASGGRYEARLDVQLLGQYARGC